MKQLISLLAEGVHQCVAHPGGSILPMSALVVFCCLNPSTADAAIDDPTLRRMMTFAEREGCDTSGNRSAELSDDEEHRFILRRGWMHVVNIYSYRTAEPAALAARPYAQRNATDSDLWIDVAAAGSTLVIAGWGSSLPRDGGANRARRVLATLRQYGPVYCLGRNADGQPSHPLYLRASTPLEIL